MPYAMTQHLEASIALAARRPEAALESFAAAIEAFKRAGKAAESRLLDARAERALALAMTGDVAAARREIEGVLTQSGDAVKFEYTHMRGTIEHLSGRYAAALALQQKALEQIAEGPVADYARARVLMQLGLSQFKAGDAGARETLERALQLATKLGMHADPMQAEARAALGR
jgi:tetratricopeptide (TPR) repeat protein